MRIELLTVSGCPHRDVTLDRVREALVLAGRRDVVVTERRVDDAEAAQAVGMRRSPTILVDGRDPFAADDTAPSLSCRLYRSERGVEGAPTVEALVDALG
ncbi:MAG: thioredoxin family protein [Acidimicrobiia bacterium]